MLALVLVAVVPLVIFGGGAAWVIVDQKKAAVAAELTSTASALQVAVDGELIHQLDAMALVAVAPRLAQGGGPAGFQEAARGALAVHDDWFGIALIEPGTHRLVAGAPTAPAPGATSLSPGGVDEVVRTRKPLIVGAFSASRIAGRPMILLLSPVLRDNEVRHVLAVAMSHKALSSIFAEQRLPASWTGAIVDAHMTLAGRSRDPQRYVGLRATPSLAERIVANQSGMFTAVNQEGATVYTVFSRSPRTGWSVAIGVPAAEVEGPLRRSLLQLGAAGAALMALALIVAGWTAHRMLSRLAASRAALVDSEQRQRLALDAAAMWAWRWDLATDRTIWADDPQGLLGPRPATGYPDFRQMVLEEDREAFLRTGGTALAGGEHYAAEFRLRRTDGRVIWMLARGKVVRDADGHALAVLGVSQDITERKHGEQKLRESEQRFQEFSATSSDWFWEMDADLRFSYFSDNAEKMLGFSPENVLGRRRDEIANVDEFNTRANWDDHLALLQRHEPFREFEYHVRSDLGGRWFSISGTPHFDADGCFQGYRGTGRNITSRKQVEKKLEAAVVAAETANVAKSRFLATMSHEIRTPMNGILGMAQLLLMPNLGEAERQDYARTVLTSGQTLLALLNDILDLSKVEAGKIELETSDFDPAQLVHEIRALFAEAAGRKALQLEGEWSETAIQRYRGDPHRLRQMLSNLVGNAIKFTAQGQVRIIGHEVAQDDTGAVLEFSVADNGIGIDEATQKVLFQPFSQADSSITREFGGTGLGLSIVKSLARLMGGDAGVESHAGQGSRFWFRVRVGRVAAGGESRHAPRPPAPAMALRQQFAGRVLVVEDTSTNRKVIEVLLKKLGVAVVLAEDGRQAVAAVTGGEAVDLILMDLQMPVMDGYAATERIRQWEAANGRPRCPIVALTANAFEEDRQKCLAAGMDDFLTKPIVLDTLIATLVEWLHGVAAESASVAPPGEVRKPIDVPRVASLWRELEPLLAQNKFDAVVLFRELQAAVAGTDLAQRVAELRPLLDEFRFEALRECLQKILSAPDQGGETP